VLQANVVVNRDEIVQDIKTSSGNANLRPIYLREIHKLDAQDNADPQ
jgi:hypothetical protein